MKIEKLIWIIGVIISPILLFGQADDMKLIHGDSYIPLYGVKGQQVAVNDFYLDIYPVTNEQYLNFVKDNSAWQKSKVISLFADDNYLGQWIDDLQYAGKPTSPATTISWYAAKAYCSSLDKRLPTMDEWEFVGMASPTNKYAQKDSIFNQMIIEGYERPRTYQQEVGSTFENYWGINDMHGLVWEWTSDFNSVLISGESRQDVDTERNLFCAGSAVNATDLMNYAAFMRYAFRGSVKANYSIRTLGFRCAQNVASESVQ